MPDTLLKAKYNASTIVMFCHASRSHMTRMLPLIEGFSRMGCMVYFFGATEFSDAIEARGGQFVDFYSRHSLSEVDPESRPRIFKHLTFSAHYGEKIAAQVSLLKPSLIVYNSFSISGPLLGERLNLPYVCVCPGVFDTPQWIYDKYKDIEGSLISEKCHTAVSKLRSLGLPEATPYFAAHCRSPYLNIWNELPEFTPARISEFIEPAVYTISLEPPEAVQPSRPLFREPTNGPTLKIFVAFGMTIWWGFDQDALSALASIARIFSEMKNVEVVISLGGYKHAVREVKKLTRHNVQVKPVVDQWSALREADTFLTHHGLNSTHEAIYCGTPMLSYPFCFDQPARARRCEELGIAIPIAGKVMGEIDRETLHSALDTIVRNRPEYDERMDAIRATQAQLTRERPSLARRILEEARFQDPQAVTRSTATPAS